MEAAMARDVTDRSRSSPTASLLAFALGAAAIGAVAVGDDQEGALWKIGGG
jgi:hypothetical protein